VGVRVSVADPQPAGGVGYPAGLGAVDRGNVQILTRLEDHMLVVPREDKVACHRRPGRGDTGDGIGGAVRSHCDEVAVAVDLSPTLSVV